jgi:hypothetical protein
MIVRISLICEMIEDFLELMALLLKLGRLCGRRNRDGPHWGPNAFGARWQAWVEGLHAGGPFDDVVILDSRRLGSLMRWLMAIGRVSGHGELVRSFLLPEMLLTARHCWGTGDGGQCVKSVKTDS